MFCCLITSAIEMLVFWAFSFLFLLYIWQLHFFKKLIHFRILTAELSLLLVVNINWLSFSSLVLWGRYSQVHPYLIFLLIIYRLRMFLSFVVVFWFGLVGFCVVFCCSFTYQQLNRLPEDGWDWKQDSVRI